MDNRKVVLDVETTGLSYDFGHRVIDIGCVELEDNQETGVSFQCYINPMRDIPLSSFNVHGLSREFLKDKPAFKDIAGDFLKFIGDDDLIIHNAPFDMSFINGELQMIGAKALQNKVIDTLVLAKKLYPGQKASLDALCKKFEILGQNRKVHGALTDSLLLARVFIEMMRGRQINIQACNENKVSRKSVQKRTYHVNKEEKQAFFDMLCKLKDPLWKKNWTGVL